MKICKRHQNEALFVCVQCCEDNAKISLRPRESESREYFFRGLSQNLNNEELCEQYLLCTDCLRDSEHKSHRFQSMNSYIEEANKKWVQIIGDF